MNPLVVHWPIVETPLARGLLWRTEADTLALAQCWAACPALRNAYVQLQGDLGSGKTTFVRCLLQALGVQGRIKSPTYAVVEPYSVHTAAGALDIWHFDFYRFSDPHEWDDAGLRDLFASPGLKLAEWPERAGASAAPCDLAIKIEAMPDLCRRVALHANTPVGQALLACLDACQQGSQAALS